MTSHPDSTKDEGFIWGLPELGVVDVSPEKAAAIRSLAGAELQRSKAHERERGGRFVSGELLVPALLSLFSATYVAWAVASVLVVLRL